MTKSYQTTKAEIEKKEIIMMTKFFDPSDSVGYSDNGSELSLTPILKEFKAGKVYQMQTQIFNCSYSREIAQLLMQIPKHAIVCGDNTSARIKTISLNPMVGVTETLSFYFPRSSGPGETVELYPPTLVQNQKIIARSEDVGEFTVLDEHAGRQALTTNSTEEPSVKDEEKLSKLTWRSVSNSTKFVTNT